MADIWVPFVAAFAAAALALVLRQILVTLTRRPGVRVPRRAGMRTAVPETATIPPERLDFSRPTRTDMARVDVVRTSPAAEEPPVPARPIIIGAPARPIIIGGPPRATETAPEPIVATVDTRPTEIAAPGPDAPYPDATDRDESARRLRVAVGPGRVSTTVGAETKVWSRWTQEVAAPADDAPAESVAQEDSGEDCPHCASARYRGARFCGRCGRHLSDAVAVTG